jgi:hypothetical protein
MSIFNVCCRRHLVSGSSSLSLPTLSAHKTLLRNLKEASIDITVAGTRWIISLYWFHELQSRPCCTPDMRTDQLSKCSLPLPPVVTDQVDDKCCERGGWRLAWHHCRFSWIDRCTTAGIMKNINGFWCWNNLLFGRKLRSRHVSNLFIECVDRWVFCSAFRNGPFFSNRVRYVYKWTEDRGLGVFSDPYR